MSGIERLGDTAVIGEMRAAMERRAKAASDDPRLADDRAATDALIARLKGVREERWRRLIPRRFWDARVDGLTGEAAAAAHEWTATSMTANVILLGTTGSGKTHTAAALARQAFEAGRSVRLLSTVELLEGLRPGGNIRWRPDRVGLLILDDLGVEKPTDWSGSVLDGIVDSRWKEDLPIVVTSNLDAGALEAHVGPRLWSRLWDGAVAYNIVGTDRRERR